ncbi:MAG: hypothetical protein ACI9VS_003209 [Candidatus Binatia bacterium]
MNDPDRPAELVVLAPDLLARSFFDPDCFRVLELWRSRRIRPVVNRDLLLRCLKLLRELGLSENLVRRWLWWFTAQTKTLYLADEKAAAETGRELCSSIAIAANVRCVICSDERTRDTAGASASAAWMSATEFTASLESGFA